MLSREEKIAIISQLEKDYAEKPLLIPQNNREYWLFTEIRQRLIETLSIPNFY